MDSNGQTSYSRIGGPSVSVSFSWDGVDVDASVPVIVPVTTTLTSGTYNWSNLFAWSAPDIALQGSVDVLNIVEGVQSGSYFEAITGAENTLVNAGPTDQIVSVDLPGLWPPTICRSAFRRHWRSPTTSKSPQA